MGCLDQGFPCIQIWIVLYVAHSLSNLVTWIRTVVSCLPLLLLVFSSESFCWLSATVRALWEMVLERTGRIKDTDPHLRSSDLLGEKACVFTKSSRYDKRVKVSKYGWEKEEVNLDWVGQRSIIEKLRAFFFFFFFRFSALGKLGFCYLLRRKIV